MVFFRLQCAFKQFSSLVLTDLYVLASVSSFSGSNLGPWKEEGDKYENKLLTLFAGNTFTTEGSIYMEAQAFEPHPVSRYKSNKILWM